MSVTFMPARADGRRLRACECSFDDTVECSACVESLNMSNTNARDLLAWLELEVLDQDLCGVVRAADLAAACRRRLWDEPRNHDPAIAPVQLSERAIVSGRSAGYLRARTRELLAVAVAAGEHWVRWS